MKKLNNFLDKAPLWQVFIVSWFILGIIGTFTFYGLTNTGNIRPELQFTLRTCIKMGVAGGFMFGFLYIFMLSGIRKSQIFWDYAKEVETLIEKANTKKELDLLCNKEFQNLRNKCQGGPQIPELNRLWAIIVTKYKYVD